MSTRFQLLSRCVLITTLFIALITGLVPTAAQDDTPWPTNGWQTSTPEEQGIDSAKLLALLDEIQTKGYTLDSLMVIRHGRIVMDAYFWPYAPDMQHELHYSTKSFTSALVGVAMQQGYIQSVDQSVPELLPGYSPSDPRWSEMMLRNVLNMTAGFDCGPDFLSLEHILKAPDWTQAMVEAQVPITPGLLWNYCQVYPQLLSSIVGEMTGMPSEQFAREQLFVPLGIIDYSWAEDPQGNAIGPFGLRLSPRDMAKLGYLYLHEGRWGEHQLVPAEYVRESTCQVADTSYCKTGSWNSWRHGYQWWIPRTDVYSFAAYGPFDVFVVVVPGKDLVVVTTTQSVFNIDQVVRLVTDWVAQAAESEAPLSENIEADTQLEARIASLAHPPARGDEEVVPAPDVAQAISGELLELDGVLDFGLNWFHFLYPAHNLVSFVPESVQVRAIRLTIGDDPSQVLFGMEFADGYSVDVAVGMDGVFRTTESRFGLLAARGRWSVSRGKTTFDLSDMHVVGDGRANNFSVYLSAEPVQVVSRSLVSASGQEVRAQVRE